MKHIELNEMNGDAAKINHMDTDGEIEHAHHAHPQSYHRLSELHHHDKGHSRRTSGVSNKSTTPISVISNVPSDANLAEVQFVSPLPAPSAGYNTHQHRKSTDTESYERQQSVLDPTLDRVSTILVWKNLVVSTREDKRSLLIQRCLCRHPEPQTKTLLHNVSGAITGGLWAVMGASGSGKSTLLNTLACRLDVNTIVEGEMRLNGALYDNAELKRVSGYVMQDDLLNGYLTVEETLIYTAELRLPRDFTKHQRRERVNEVLNDLNLTHVRNDVIGFPSKQGISGSERKRLCVCMQLLNRPQLLFLDEPTTGLDSVTALDLLHTLYGLAHGKSQAKAVTVVCSIHQPQAKIFNLFDSMVLLKAGRIIYQGSRKLCTEVFRAAGFPCPSYTNPADHILDVITPGKSTPSNNDEPPPTKEQQAAIDEAILNAQPRIEVDLNMGADKRLTQMTNLSRNPPWYTQVAVLFRRNLREQSRKLSLILTSIVQTVIMAVLIGTVFLRIGDTQTSIVRREAALFYCSINQCVFGALTVINSFPVERTLTLRERASGTYCASAYFIAKVLSDTLVKIPVPIIFSIIVYFLIGFQENVGKFFIFMIIIVLCSLTSNSLAVMISAICRTTALSVTVLPVVLETSRLFGGYFMAPVRLPKYFSWLDALSYVKYTYTGIALNELSGLKLSCAGATTTTVNASYTIPTACIQTGEVFIQERGYDYINVIGCILVLVGFIVFFRGCAFLGVRFLKH